MADDIFVQFDQLFRGQKPEGKVPVFMMHRFFASEIAYAPYCKEFAKIPDDDMIVELWRTGLPRQGKAPYFSYCAPKKGIAPDELVKKVADFENISIYDAEELVGMLYNCGQVDLLLQFHGVTKFVSRLVRGLEEQKEKESGEKPKRGRKKKSG